MPKKVTIPPDGGYGWAIVVASAINNIVTVPMGLSFGMVLEEPFHMLGLSAYETSLIININSAVGMLTGLINGLLLNKYGFRKVSVVGSFLMFVGVLSMAFTQTWTEYMLCYGFLTSLGVGLTMSAHSLALNSYFCERRDRAMSIAMACSGLGPILYPQIINLLMEFYDPRGVMLILSGFCAHSFIAACLLQPVEKHEIKMTVDEMKDLRDRERHDTETKLDEVVEVIDRYDPEHEEEVYHTVPALTSRFAAAKAFSQMDRLRYSRKDSSNSFFEQEGAGLYGIDSALIGSSMISLQSVRLPSLVRPQSRTKYQWWTSASTINLQSSYDLFDEKPPENNNPDEERVYNELCVHRPEKPSRWRRFLLGVVVLFDLDLLKDKVYCNIMLGISIAIFAELNFSILTVFILSEFGLDLTEVSEFLSIVGTADIAFRFLAPYIGDCLGKSPRLIYIITLVVLAAMRHVMYSLKGTAYLLVVAAFLGAFKGIRSVYMYLIIPNYVPIEKLASASGIQMVTNGMVILIGGPLIGLVRDVTGSYRTCILIINAATVLTVLMWGAEFVLLNCRRPNKAEDSLEDNPVDVPLNTV